MSRLSLLKLSLLLLPASLLLILPSCDQDGMSTDDPVWTLYSSNEHDQRVHVATFDVIDMNGSKHSNEARCKDATVIHSSYAKSKYWCEIGRYRRG